MIFTIGFEALAVLGLGGAGVGGGVYVDTDGFAIGPYAYALAGGGLGAYGGATIQVGVYRSLSALAGPSLELGLGAGDSASVGIDASVARRGIVGIAGSGGAGAGIASWVFGCVCWAGRPFRRRSGAGVTAPEPTV